jgi:chloramphenicol-sensitive protein RarD
MENREKASLGYILALQAFVAWGLLPVYWKLLKHVPAVEILAHRILWSALFTLLFLWWKGKFNLRPLLFSRPKMAILVTAAILVGGNWGIYIYAVNANHIVEASLGYYINPLVSVMLGVLVLKERLDNFQKIALVLALSAVIYLTIDYGRFPWIAIYLAFSFGIYGLLKKMSNFEAMPALAVETIVLTPFALLLIGHGVGTGTGAFPSSSWLTNGLLMLTGVATTLPLYWFAQAAQRIPLSSVGFMQYLSPTLSLILGVGVYGEPFHTQHVIAFGIIWIALAFYTISIVRRSRANKVSSKRSQAQTS